MKSKDGGTTEKQRSKTCKVVNFDEVLVNWEIPELSPQEYEEDGWELDISASHPPHKKYELN